MATVDITVDQELALITNNTNNKMSEEGEKVVVTENDTGENGHDPVVAKIVLQAATTPEKRGRGRPPKAWHHKPSPHVKHVKETAKSDSGSGSDSDSEKETNSSPVKKGRGRPMKAPANDSIEISSDVSASVSDRSAATPPSSEPSEPPSSDSHSEPSDDEYTAKLPSPAKRGRGRPPKPGGAKKRPASSGSPGGAKRGRGRPPKSPGAARATKPPASKASTKSDASDDGSSSKGRGRPKGSFGKKQKVPSKNIFTDEMDLPSKRIPKKPERYAGGGLGEDALNSMFMSCLDQQRQEICTYVDMRISKVERRLDTIEATLQKLQSQSQT